MIRKISIDIMTGQDEGAGTDGDVYLGIGGREFCLEAVGFDNFEEGEDVTYVLGEDANVKSPERNDPRRGLPLGRSSLEGFPVYVRLDPHGAGDDWQLSYVKVTVHGSEGEDDIEYGALGDGHQLWLGRRYGKYCYLRLLAD